MLIKKIRLKNFKNFKDAELELGNMNVLVGANASGKSNFLQALKFLKDIQEHGLENAISPAVARKIAVAWLCRVTSMYSASCRVFVFDVLATYFFGIKVKF